MVSFLLKLKLPQRRRQPRHLDLLSTSSVYSSPNPDMSSFLDPENCYPVSVNLTNIH